MTYQPKQITPDLGGIPMGAYAGEAAPVPQLMNMQVPPGTLIEFAGTASPYGYLVCPIAQTNLSRLAYPDLFAAIGTTWGAGDGVSTFGMPWFPVDYATIQANGNVASSSVGSVISHTHTYTDGTTGTSGTVGFSGSGGQTANTGATGGGSNYPAGIRVLRCVKY